MSYSPMDLDSSLDDLIKKRKSNKPNDKKNKKVETRPPVQTNKAKITKTPPRNSNINSRLSVNKKSGPLFTAKNKPTPTIPQKTDPSKIIITKNISPINKTGLSKNASLVNRQDPLKSISLVNRTGPSKNTKTTKETPIPSHLSSRLGNHSETPQVKSVIRGRLGNTISLLPQEKQEQLSFRSSHLEEKRPAEGFRIRGISNTAEPTKQTAFREDSGPTTVLITGIDKQANSYDVQVFLSQFGEILRCEVLKDRAGRSFGEAEVEFKSKGSALDCIAMLDNQMADGNFLRVILREPKSPQNYAAKQIRSIISSAPASGQMHSSQMSSRYNIQRR